MRSMTSSSLQMESHGIFDKDAPFKNKGNRRVNFKNDHDDRFDDKGGGYNSGQQGGRGYDRGGRGRWTRGQGRGRGGGGGYRGGRGGANPRTRFEEDDYRGEGNGSYRGKKRYTPYSKSPPGGGGHGRGRGGRGSVFSRLGGQSSRGDKGGGSSWRGGGGKGSVFGRLSGLGGDGNEHSQEWHKIMIVGGANMDNDDVIRQLQSQIDEPFKAQQVHSKGDKLMFFIEESRAANEMKRLGDSAIVVKPSPPPRGIGGGGGGRGGGGERGGGSWGKGGSGGWQNDSQGDRRVTVQRRESDMMEEDPTAVLLQVLGERFDTINMSLDLSDMFHDRTLQLHNIRGSMFDNSFVNSVLELISIHCPNLNALDLSNNKIQRLQAYSSLKEKCPNIQILDLSDNQLRYVQDLEAIAPISSVTTLVLENNPLHEEHLDFVAYAGNLRKYFPNLRVLRSNGLKFDIHKKNGKDNYMKTVQDSQQLPSPVKFDLPTSTGSLPPSEKGYLVNEEVRSLVVSFLEQYYTIYDGDSRDKLLEAYSDNAVFSLCVNSPQQQRGPNFYLYLPFNRNLVTVKDAGERSMLIKHGRIDVVQMLRNFPRTFHIASSFSVDVMRASPVGTAFTVHGVFSEDAGPKSELHPIRAFSRTFVLVAAGNGVAIVNDQLSIRNASKETVQQYQYEVQQHFSQLQPQTNSFMSSGMTSTIPSQLSPPSTSAVPFGATSQLTGQQQPFVTQPPSFGNTQDEAAATLSIETAMNIEWSKKCLAENSWNYDKALAAFKVIRSQGKIPPEAFN